MGETDLQDLFLESFDDLGLELRLAELIFRVHPHTSVEQPLLVFTAGGISQRPLIQDVQVVWREFFQDIDETYKSDYPIEIIDAKAAGGSPYMHLHSPRRFR